MPDRKRRARIDDAARTFVEGLIEFLADVDEHRLQALGDVLRLTRHMGRIHVVPIRGFHDGFAGLQHRFDIDRDGRDISLDIAEAIRLLEERDKLRTGRRESLGGFPELGSLLDELDERVACTDIVVDPEVEDVIAAVLLRGACRQILHPMRERRRRDGEILSPLLRLLGQTEE